MEAESLMINRPAGVYVFLSEIYPDVFNERNFIPLKIGIHQDIRSRHPNLQHRALRGFLFWWTKRPGYREAIMGASAMRYDLDSNEVEPVAKEAAAYAKEVSDKIATTAGNEHGFLKRLPEAYRLMLSRAPVVAFVGEEHERLLKDISCHPKAAEKVGSGVAHFCVHDTFPSFVVVRTDGTRASFSIKRCLEGHK